MRKISIVFMAAPLLGCFLGCLALNADAQQMYTTKSRQNRLGDAMQQPGSRFENADLELIRKRIIDDLLQPAVNVNAMQNLVETILPDGSWAAINYIDTSRTGFQHRLHLEHMVDLARTYKKQGSSLYQNPAVKKTALAALDFWLAHDFRCANWWWNEMGTPNLMINTLLLLDEDLSEQQKAAGLQIANRANLEAFGARPGGDLIQIAGMLGKQGLFKRDEQIIERVIKTMAAEIQVSNGRGLQPDMSFHHRTDRVISTLTYGTGYVSAFAYWAVKIAGTKYTLPNAAVKQLIDYYLDGISKSMAFGKYPDPGAKNRDLTRKGTLDAVSAEIPANLLIATDGYRKNELEQLIKIRSGEQQPNLQWNKYFWHSSYFSHQRPAWFSSVRMHSSRQNNMEEPHNEEGLKNHHFADGSNFITISGDEYVDVFPVWDWQKIPGATIVQKPTVPPFKQVAKKGLGSFVGGVSDGRYGAAAFDFSSVHDPLKAKKAWFFFSDEYVCLGTGIFSGSEYPVTTTLNQCNLKGDVTAGADGKNQVLQPGEHSLKKAAWIHHNKVAYIFETPVNVNVRNNTATGNWRQINHQEWATETPVQRNLFTTWLDHGIAPNGAGYAYIVVPGIEADQVKKYQSAKGVSILQNTSKIQAVYQHGLQMTQVIFYEPATIRLNNGVTITANQPCMMVVEAAGKQLKKIAVSDPTQLLSRLQFTIQSGTALVTKKEGVTVTTANGTTVIDIVLPRGGDAGKSLSFNFGK